MRIAPVWANETRTSAKAFAASLQPAPSSTRKASPSGFTSARRTREAPAVHSDGRRKFQLALASARCPSSPSDGEAGVGGCDGRGNARPASAPARSPASPSEGETVMVGCDGRSGEPGSIAPSRKPYRRAGTPPTWAGTPLTEPPVPSTPGDSRTPLGFPRPSGGG